MESGLISEGKFANCQVWAHFCSPLVIIVIMTTLFITSGIQEQLNMIQDEHRQTVDALRSQLESAELEIDRLHTLRIASANNVATAVPASPDPRDVTLDRASDYPREIRGEERQSGEVCVIIAVITNVIIVITNYRLRYSVLTCHV